VHHLVVALLQLPVYVDVLDVELGQVLEDFIVHPGLDDLKDIHTARAYFLAGLVLLCGHVLHFDLERLKPESCLPAPASRSSRLQAADRMPYSMVKYLGGCRI
jgi:hypothetical protein